MRISATAAADAVSLLCPLLLQLLRTPLTPFIHSLFLDGECMHVVLRVRFHAIDLSIFSREVVVALCVQMTSI